MPRESVVEATKSDTWQQYRPMNRRAFFAVGGQSAIFALATRVTSASAAGAQRQPPALNDVERRVAGVIEAFDAQGNHRTGTELDRQSGEWLSAQVQRLGVHAVLEPFTLNRIDLRSSYVRIADRRIDGLPLFDAGFTDPQGIRGALVRWAAMRRSHWWNPNPNVSPTPSRCSAIRSRRRGARRTRQ
jgi:hypothetical protein